MKQLALPFLLTCAFAQTATGQISISKAAPPAQETIAPYDSIRNFLGKDYKQYIGQEFYVMPKHQDLRKYGYEGFIVDYNQSLFNIENRYKCCDSHNTMYAALEGKYLTVIDAIEDPKSKYSGYAYLKLQEKDTKDQFFYRIKEVGSEYTFPFLVVGHYEKLKKQFIGNEILLRPFPKPEGGKEKQVSIETGEEIDLEQEELVKCVDVTLDDKSYKLYLVLETKSGQRFMFPAYARSIGGLSRIFTKDEATKYKESFGEKYWKAILEETVVVGMSEEMVLLSWGTPKKVNRTSSGDQWVYSDNYIYFENGKMTSFN
jgi:hypothetical protein